jgi:hypothetical protein
MSLQEQEPQEDLQPFGITLIAALTAIVPLVILLRGNASTMSLLAAVLGVVAGAGLFFQKTWARWLTIAYYAAAMVLMALNGAGLSTILLASILPLAIIGYLLLPGVAASFASKKAS